MRWGVTVGLVVAVMGLVPNFLFGRKSIGLYLIEAGQIILAITIIGAIIGAWP